LPLHLSAEDLPGGQTQKLNVRGIRTINRHPVETDENSSPVSILDTEYCLNWNGDLGNPNDSADDCEGDIESDIEPDDTIEDSEYPEQ